MSHLIAVILCFFIFATPGFSQQIKPPGPVAIGNAEVNKVEERIALIRRDTVDKYGAALAELQLHLQKLADLEGALAVRAERTRVAAEKELSQSHFVKQPRALQTLQQQWHTKMQDMISSVVNDTVPKLVELKRQLTVDGQLDEAVAIRESIERLQNANVPVERVPASSAVTAEILTNAYAGDRARADKIYKGVRISVRGLIAGHRIDPADSQQVFVFLSGGSGALVQCSFPLKTWKHREDKFANQNQLVLIARDGTEYRMIKGQPAEISGDCTGWDEMVRLSRCGFAR